MKRIINRNDLIKYCKQHGIFIPNERTVKVKYLLSSIHRALMHGKSPELTAGCCYGYWEKDNMDCEVCNFNDDCFEQSMGISKEEYNKKWEKEEDSILTTEKDFRK